jgi:hypothetical protein
MNKFFTTDNELKEDTLRNEILRITGVYCQAKDFPVPEPCKKVLAESTPEELAETKEKLTEE